MEITIESTTKIVELNGVPARVWEGKTNTGIKVHCYMTRIAIDIDEPEEVAKQFKEELIQCKTPSTEIEAIPAKLIL